MQDSDYCIGVGHNFVQWGNGHVDCIMCGKLKGKDAHYQKQKSTFRCKLFGCKMQFIDSYREPGYIFFKEQCTRCRKFNTKVIYR